MKTHVNSAPEFLFPDFASDLNNVAIDDAARSTDDCISADRARPLDGKEQYCKQRWYGLHRKANFAGSAPLR